MSGAFPHLSPGEGQGGWSAFNVIHAGFQYAADVQTMQRASQKVTEILRPISSGLKKGERAVVQIGFYPDGRYFGKWITKYVGWTVISTEEILSSPNVRILNFNIEGPQDSDVSVHSHSTIQGFQNSMEFQVTNKSPGFRTFYYSFRTTQNTTMKACVSSIPPGETRKATHFSNVASNVAYGWLNLTDTAVGNNAYIPDRYQKLGEF